MAEIFNRLWTALWETVVFFWPIWFIFVAAMSLAIAYFVYLTFRDASTHAAGSRNAARPGGARSATASQVTPDPSGFFDQEQLPAWMPTGPESWAEYRRFHRGHRKQRAAARRSVA